MPLYVFECENGHRFDEFLKLEEYDKPMTCECGKSAKRQIVPTMLNMDMPNWERYVSPTTGKLITSYKQRKDDMKASGCVDYEPSIKKTSEKKRKQQADELDKKIEETVERQIESLTGDQRESLVKEMTSKDINIERKSA